MTFDSYIYSFCRELTTKATPLILSIQWKLGIWLASFPRGQVMDHIEIGITNLLENMVNGPHRQYSQYCPT
jgi:hypothetical protein